MIEFVGGSPLPAHLVERAELFEGGPSFIVRGRRYDVFHARGTVAARQDAANRAGVICYVEQHLNANAHESPWYASAHLPPAATRHGGSAAFAKAYVDHVAREHKIPHGGVREAPSNCARMRCPAFLAEPTFLSNPEMSRWLRSGEGTEALARSLAETIVLVFPGGGLVGLSVGHAYRGNGDPGAPARIDGDEVRDRAYDDEAEIADGIVNLATELLVMYE